MSRLKDKYIQEAVPALIAKFGYENPMMVPRLEKVVLNMGVGDARENPRSLENAANEMTKIAGLSRVSYQLAFFTPGISPL